MVEDITVKSVMHSLVVAVACLWILHAVPAAAQDLEWPTAKWTTGLPGDHGIPLRQAARIDSLIEKGVYGYVDRLVVVKDGVLVVDEQYVNDYEEISRGFVGALGCGHDSCDGMDISPEYNYYWPGTHPFYQKSYAHSLQSVTKSVAATVIGVAIQRGDIESLDEKLLGYFDEYDLKNVDPRLKDVTLFDLLTMRSGIEWHEQDRPLDSTNTTLMLEHSDDWIQFTLDQPMDAAPGTKWVYNSGGSHLMSGVIKDATGEFIDEYAREYLFGPMGIELFHWKKTPKGYPDTEGGLYLEATDLAKIGLLYLNDGIWDGNRLLPDGWVDLATSRIVDPANFGRGYGLQWWRIDREGVDIWAGLGFGEQYLLVVPNKDLVVVVNSWNLFDRPQASILRDVVDLILAIED